MIGYKNTISGGSSIMQPIRIPENTTDEPHWYGCVFKYFCIWMGLISIFVGVRDHLKIISKAANIGILLATFDSLFYISMTNYTVLPLSTWCKTYNFITNKRYNRLRCYARLPIIRIISN